MKEVMMYRYNAFGVVYGLAFVLLLGCGRQTSETLSDVEASTLSDIGLFNLAEHQNHGSPILAEINAVLQNYERQGHNGIMSRTAHYVDPSDESFTRFRMGILDPRQPLMELHIAMVPKSLGEFESEDGRGYTLISVPFIVISVRQHWNEVDGDYVIEITEFRHYTVETKLWDQGFSSTAG